MNWRIINHAVKNLPHPRFAEVQDGCGIWAPVIRFYDGKFWIFFPMPDEGIYVTTAANPAREWSEPHLVQAGKGLIDPCPFWDDDGNAYLIHAWAKSRVGFNSLLTIHRMTVDGTKLLDSGTVIFDGSTRHPTIEGPKLYRRNGWYYIFAPAGGVESGWQTVLRATNIFGPYEDRVVLAQGNTEINGPHQGAWVETKSGESWFFHFQDRGPYGRVVHLQPMKWVDDWPVIGNDDDGDDRGEPVLTYRKPNVDRRRQGRVSQTTDEFDSHKLGLQWQWQANHRKEWFSLSARPGWLRLFSMPPPGKAANLWPVPNLLLQKLPAPEFSVIAKLDVSHLAIGERAGLIIMGQDYSFLVVRRAAAGCRVVKVACHNAAHGAPEIVEGTRSCPGKSVILAIDVRVGAICTFRSSLDGDHFVPLGKPFTACKGKWVGAKVGLFSLSTVSRRETGYTDFNWFRFT
jgi:beta-xylosidase